MRAPMACPPCRSSIRWWAQRKGAPLPTLPIRNDDRGMFGERHNAQNNSGCLGRHVGIGRRRARGKFPVASHHHRGAVLRRRAVGCDVPDPGRADEGHARRSPAGRECHGGGRFDRGRARGALAARWLHHQFWASRHPRRQWRDLQARLRSRDRSRAGGAAAEQSDDRRQQERDSRQIAKGIAGVAEGEAGARDGRHRRRRFGEPHRRPLFRERQRRQVAIRAVSRHRAGHERPRRRPDRSHHRSDLEFHRPGPRRQHSRLRHQRRQADRVRA